jgi:hypothetical protein
MSPTGQTGQQLLLSTKRCCPYQAFAVPCTCASASGWHAAARCCAEKCASAVLCTSRVFPSLQLLLLSHLCAHPPQRPLAVRDRVYAWRLHRELVPWPYPLPYRVVLLTCLMGAREVWLLCCAVLTDPTKQVAGTTRPRVPLLSCTVHVVACTLGVGRTSSQRENAADRLNGGTVL